MNRERTQSRAKATGRLNRVFDERHGQLVPTGTQNVTDCKSQNSVRAPIQAVIFDMDGLMFNTEDLYDGVLGDILKQFGLPFSMDLKRKMMGLPGPKAFEVMRAECGLSATVEQLEESCHSRFAERLPSFIQRMPGLETILSLVESLGLPKAVATSSRRQIAQQALGCFDLESRFSFILTGQDVERGKPNPDIYLEACRQLHVEPENTLVFEDSWNGSLAAAAAGVQLIVVPTHHSSHLTYDHADFRVPRLDDPLVLKILNANAPY